MVLSSRLLLLAITALFVQQSAGVISSGVDYRWAYRNPLSIANASAVDLGGGSYNGTVNSTLNQPSSSTQVLAYSHGATTAFLPNGSLAVIWQGSPLWWEGNLKQAAYWALSNDGGATFGPARKIFALNGTPLWGPTIHVDGDVLYMFYSGTAPASCLYQGEGGPAYPPGGPLTMTTSTDNGATWSSSVVILPTEFDGGSGKLNIGRLVVNSRGDWLLPFWREQSGPPCWNPLGTPSNGVPGVLQSNDKGRSWVVSVPGLSPAPGTPPTQWLIENIIVPYHSNGTGAHSNATLLQTFRSNSTRLWQSWSSDDGAHWSPPAPGPITTPNTKTDLTSLPDGSILIAFNNATWQRTNLTLARSTDSGVTWQHLAIIEADSNAAFSYPTVTYHAATAKVSVVYSVWQLPNYQTAALAPTGTPPSSSQSLPQGGQLGRTPPLQTAGRRLKQLDPAADVSYQQAAGRRLAQVPFTSGAWGKVSYGIRMAVVDLAPLLAGQIGGRR